MKIAPSKKDFGDYFVSWGWLIVLFIGLSYVAWYWPISALDAIKDYEKINFFFESYGLNDNALQANLLTDLNSNGVLEVNLYCYSPADVSLTSYYDKFGAESDFLVLSEADLDSMFLNAASTNVTKGFVPFSAGLKEVAIPTDDYAYYDVGGVAYGLEVFSPSDSSYDKAHPFTDLLDFTFEGVAAQPFFLLLNAQTPNFKPYDSDAVTANAVEALKYFLAEYR